MSMAPFNLRTQFLATTRGRIVTMLRRGGATVDDLAAALGLTPNAVRSQLALMVRDGIVQMGPQRRGATRPSNVFELTAEADQILSRAYVPFVAQLVTTLAKSTPPRELERVLRETGRDLAAAIPFSPSADFGKSVKAVSDLLNTHIGALTTAEKPNGHYVIRGHGCPLSAVTRVHPVACRSVETMLATLLGADVKTCCAHDGAPSCCFEIQPPRRQKARQSRRSR
jgi:predicted ArsR family transcriptional regulator